MSVQRATPQVSDTSKSTLPFQDDKYTPGSIIFAPSRLHQYQISAIPPQTLGVQGFKKAYRSDAHGVCGESSALAPVVFKSQVAAYANLLLWKFRLQEAQGTGTKV